MMHFDDLTFEGCINTAQTDLGLIQIHVSFGFDDESADLRLLANIDHLNFRELPAATPLGWLRDGAGLQLEVRDDNDQDVRDRYFAVTENRLVTARPLMPSMFTLDKDIIRQDCLGYLMERLLPE